MLYDPIRENVNVIFPRCRKVFIYSERATDNSSPNNKKPKMDAGNFQQITRFRSAEGHVSCPFITVINIKDE